MFSKLLQNKKILKRFTSRKLLSLSSYTIVTESIGPAPSESLLLPLDTIITESRGPVPSESLSLTLGTTTIESRGAIAIFAVLVVAAGSLVLASNAAWLGLGGLENGYTMSKGFEAWGYADGCVEEALEQLRYDNNYGVGEGTLSFTLDNGSCTLDITDTGGSARNIISEGIVDTIYRKKLDVDVTASGITVTITDWLEAT